MRFPHERLFRFQGTMDTILRQSTGRALCPLTAALALCALATGCGDVVGDSPLSDTPPESVAPSDGEGQWRGWRGAALNGVSGDEWLPIQWSAAKGLRFTAHVPGSGNSSPVVLEDRVLLTSAVGSANQRELALLCFDRASGRLLWQRTAGTPAGTTHSKNGHASATVATDGQRVFSFFGSAGLFCHDLEGERLWHVPMDSLKQKWGFASSPVVYGPIVIQLCDGEKVSYIAAFDRQTGTQVWRTERPSQGCWTTPVIVQAQSAEGPRPELVVNGTGGAGGSAGYVIAYDPLTGEELWRVSGTTDIPCPTTIVADGLVVSTSGHDGPVIAIEPGGNGDVTDTHVVWRHANGGPYVPTGVALNGRLYLINDGGMVVCLDLQSGQRKWKKRLRGTFSASLVAGEDRIYAVSEQGDVFVFAAADRFRLLAANRMHERCLATPAISYGQFFLRTENRLYCVAAREPVDPKAPTDAADGDGSGAVTGDQDVLPSPSDGTRKTGAKP